MNILGKQTNWRLVAAAFAVSLAALAIVGGGYVDAQRGGPPPAPAASPTPPDAVSGDEDEVVERIETRLVGLTVRVTDAKGRTVDADPSALKVTADGVEQRVAHVDADRDATVALLVDTSKSMRGGVAWRTRALVSAFLKASDERNRYVLYVFNDEVRKVGEFGGDAAGREALLAALRGESYGGNTALYRACEEAGDVVSRLAGTGKRALVVFTDGRDTGSPPRAGEVATLDRFGGMAAAVVIRPNLEGRELGGNEREEVTRRAADELRRVIGGETYVARGTDGSAEGAARRLAENLARSVQLGFYPSGPQAAPGTHRLEVSTSGAPLKALTRPAYVIQ